MARPKGSKNKTKTEVQKEMPKETVGNPPRSDNMEFNDPEREAAYREFGEKRDDFEPTIGLEEEPEATPEEVETETVPEETEVSAPPEPENTVVAEETEPEKPEYTETVPEETVTGFKPKEEESMVPLGALHKEREQRKELQKQVKALEEKIASVVGEDTYGEEDKITQLERKIDQLTNVISNREQNNEVQRVNNIVKDIDNQLSEQGYPGFSKFGREHVANIINGLYAQSEELGETYDNPQGWMEIYKAEYPLIKKSYDEVFRGVDKQSHLVGKRDKKLNAGLVTSSGRKLESAPKPEEDYSLEGYAQRRMKSIL